jgi:hypothetical protein
MLSLNIRCDQIYNFERIDFDHTFMCHLSQTWMFNKPISEGSSLNESLCLAGSLGVTKFTILREMILITFFVLLKSVLEVQQTHLRGQFVEQMLVLRLIIRCDQLQF